MKTTEILKKSVLLAAVALSSTLMSAQPYHHRVHHGPYARPARVAVVASPAVVVCVENRFTQKERLEIAISYLREHKVMKPKKYARLTGLPLKTAKAELEAFARDAHKPIARVKGEEGKLYRLRK